MCVYIVIGYVYMFVYIEYVGMCMCVYTVIGYVCMFVYIEYVVMCTCMYMYSNWVCAYVCEGTFRGQRYQIPWNWVKCGCETLVVASGN